MTKEKIILEKINNVETIGLVTHEDGDGDAFGSVLALERVLSQMGKEIIFFSSEEYMPEILQLNGDRFIKPVKEYREIDLLVCLDFSMAKRAALKGVVENAQKNNVPILLIDHHRLGDIKDIAKFLYTETGASSTSEIVFDLVKGWGYKIDSQTANFLLFGLETDTMSLTNGATSESAFKVVSELLKLGARVKPVISAMQTRTVPSVKLIGRALKRLHLNKELNLAATYITAKDMKELNLDEKTANSGLANYLDQIKEAGNIMVFAETEPGIVKVSMRSNRSGANVAELGEFFGGGGHVQASGYKFAGNIEEIIKKH